LGSAAGVHPALGRHVRQWLAGGETGSGGGVCVVWHLCPEAGPQHGGTADMLRCGAVGLSHHHRHCHGTPSAGLADALVCLIDTVMEKCIVTESKSAQGNEESTGPTWERRAVRCLMQESARSADTHLLRLQLPGFPGIGFYFKDESSHPSGSLKHRLARS